MSSRSKLPINLQKHIKKIIFSCRRRWLPISLACLFLFLSLFPIPFPKIFFSTSSNNNLPTSLISPVNAQTAALCATPGKDGVGAPAGVVNTYYPGTATVAAGSTSIPVGAKDPSGAATDISAGDLLLIIQMQDAVIDSTNTDAYGDGVGGDVPALAVGGTQPTNGASGFTSGTAGRYEYVVANGPVSAGSVPIRGTNALGLINTYSSAAATAAQGKQTYQVVRVPQYSTSTLGSATSPYWNGNTGGIVVFDVAGNLDLTGSVNVDGRGFRGGGGRQLNGGVGLNTDYRTLATVSTNGSKAEGIAGTPRFLIDQATLALIDNGILNEGYPNGSYGRGSPGNAGGGSTDGNPPNNDQNSGGGGGSNGGFGGIGGRAWNSNLPTGGFGGKPFPAASNLLVLGGGGGAGTTNNATGALAGLSSSGASGGGLVMLRTNTVSGTGTINANGSSAINVLNDGGGGGGAGGSVLVSALSNNLAGLTVNVRGGKGGDAIFAAPHGPGGGGGGGVVVASAGVTINRQGGAAGITGNGGADPSNAALAGEGSTIPIPLDTIPGASSGAICSLPAPAPSPSGTLTSCDGVLLPDYSGFSVGLYELLNSTGGIGSALSLTSTTPSDQTLSNKVVGVSPNSYNANPFFFTNSDQGKYNFLLDPSRGQVDPGREFVLAIKTPSNSTLSGRQIKITINSRIGNSVTYTATSLDGNPISASNSATSVNGTIVITNSSSVSLAVFSLAINICDTQAIQILKTGDRAAAEPGDIVVYRLAIRNLSSTPINQPVITDNLPLGFQFVSNSLKAELNGASVAVAVERSGRNLTFRPNVTLPVASSNLSLNIVYAAEVTNDAIRGNGINQASVSGVRANNQQVVRDGPVTYQLRIRPGILSDCGTLLGRVFIDKNFDGEQQPGEPGVPNAVIYMDDGTRILTDANGLYSLGSVLSGSRTMVIDLTSVPGYTIAPNLYFIERNSQSRLVRLAPGGLGRVNFALTPAARGINNTQQGDSK
ncbi:MAG: hypothetical protein DCF19_01955 [Pseudanabaena frigida]|uniref:DUF11 domain-containing protein n=1 Tax=Pseudanabaena frigida TaxID=945775 RepID=A0A2W4WHD9_9CYAN|nr:MAG: hypothetical protein DCF19_01955 [Pseudanabaena frigida]